MKYKKDIIIHIGLHKTATTFLQKDIFPYVRGYNFIYYFDFKKSYKYSKKIIISDETLSGTPFFNKDPNVRFDIAGKLKLLFPEARILLVLREKEGWVKSLYGEYVRKGGYCSFNTFKKNFNKGWLEYHKYIDYLKNTFNDLYVCYYEDLRFNHYKFVKNICFWIGVKPPKYKNVVRRKGFTKNQLLVVRSINFIIPRSAANKLWKFVTYKLN